MVVEDGGDGGGGDGGRGDGWKLIPSAHLREVEKFYPLEGFYRFRIYFFFFFSRYRVRLDNV